MLDCIQNDKIRNNPREKIDAFFEANKEALEKMSDTRALYLALDQFCIQNSFGYDTVEKLLRTIIEPALDQHIFTA